MSDSTTFDRDVRLYIYQYFLARGVPPTAAETGRELGASVSDVTAAYDRLAAARVIVLEPGTSEILMASPLSTVPTRFRVSLTDGRSYWGNCVWDALGIPAMLGHAATVHAACGDCDAPLSLEVRNGSLVRAEGVIHFAVPAAKWWEDIVFT